MPVVVVIGPSAAGKSSLVADYLAQHPDAQLHKSATTRPQRDADDKTHDFMTDSQFDAAVAAKQFLPPVEVYGQRYALPHLPADSDKLLFVLIRQQFVPAFKSVYPDAVVIQVEASPDTLINRLANRSDAARDDADSLAQETSQGRQVADHIIVNDGDINSSYKEFASICNSL